MPIQLSLAAFLMTLLGGLVADRVGRRRHLVPGFAAGVMLGVVAFDLLPGTGRRGLYQHRHADPHRRGAGPG